jgi:hypothetical protein
MTDASYELWRAPIGTPGPLTTPGKILFAGEAACKRMTGYMQGEGGAAAACMSLLATESVD